jgi:hypothetical protein
MLRVIAYIDGFNLYFGLTSQGWERFLWLDVQALSRNLLKPGFPAHRALLFSRAKSRRRQGRISTSGLDFGGEPDLQR